MCEGRVVGGIGGWMVVEVAGVSVGNASISRSVGIVWSGCGEGGSMCSVVVFGIGSMESWSGTGRGMGTFIDWEDEECDGRCWWL
jgi:hypothetical protein